MSKVAESFGPQEAQTQAEQSTLFFVLPKDRQKGWIVYGDHVIFLVDERGELRFRTGYVCSTPNSHVGIDNESRVVVWCDQVLNELSDNGDDAHERSFEVKDPRLIKLDEAKYLCQGKNALAWFKGIYSPHEILLIQRLLQQDDLGLLAEVEEMADARKSIADRINLNLHWWQEHGCPHPIYGKVGRSSSKIPQQNPS